MRYHRVNGHEAFMGNSEHEILAGRKKEQEKTAEIEH
jgi:hypothetical protein